MNENNRYLLPLNLQMFAADPEPTPEPTPNDPPADPKVEPQKSFTQDEIDRIVADRITRERKKYADYDEVKTKLSDFEKADEERKKAAMSEKERLEAEKAEALRKAEEAVTERDKTLQAANQRLIKAEFRALARELGVRPDALDDAYKLADVTAVTVDDEGNAAGVKDVVEALLKNKPYLADAPKREAKSIGNASNPNPDNTAKTAEQLLRDAAQKARESGRIEDMVAYSALKAELSK